MKKLFVDDIRNAPDDSWTVARTVTAAISAIDTFSFDVISLDHDISHQVVMGGLSRPYPCDETFTPVAQFIARRYGEELTARKIRKEVGMAITCTCIDCPERTGGECNAYKLPKIIIHTSNPAGAVRMAGHLQGFEIERRESAAANRLEQEV